MTSIIVVERRISSTSAFTDCTNEMLLQSLAKNDTPIFLRASLFYELARRRDPRVLLHIDGLLTTMNIEDWFVAVESLSLFADHKAFLWLSQMYSHLDLSRRLILVQLMGRMVTHDEVPIFKKFLTDIFYSSVIDITGWTGHAVDALLMWCKRRGIKVAMISSGSPYPPAPNIPDSTTHSSSLLPSVTTLSS